jgi:hypothetical protein
MSFYKHIIHDSTNNQDHEFTDTNANVSNETLLTFGNIENLTVSNVDISAEVALEVNEAKRKLQDEALSVAWDFITPYFDQPAFIQMADWKHSLASDHVIQPYIAAVEAWKAAIMFEYLMVKKPSLWNGLPYDLDYSFVGSPPCKFTDIFLLANPQFQPYAVGWSAPDITNYAPGSRQNPKPILF